MVILVPQLSLRLYAFRPVDHERIAGSAGKLRVTLEHLERRAEGDGPACRIMVVGVGAAKCIEKFEVLGQIIRIPVEKLVLVHGAVGTSFAGCAVIGAV